MCGRPGETWVTISESAKSYVLSECLINCPSVAIPQVPSSVAVAWSTNAVTVKLVKRCAPSQPYVFAAAVPGDFPILAATSDVSPSISAVDDTDKAIGIYVLTTLAATDDLLIRAQDDDASNQTHVSNPVTIVI